MKKLFVALVLLFFLSVSLPAGAQCSICTRTAAQMGERPAKGLNAGILYLAFTPMIVVAVIGYRWWKRNGGMPTGEYETPDSATA